MKTGIELIAEERQRQIIEEGRTIELDLFHNDKSQLSLAAAAYAIPDSVKHPWGEEGFDREDVFPWDRRWWKPTPENRIRELQKAGALIAAEIDRLQYSPVIPTQEGSAEPNY